MCIKISKEESLQHAIHLAATETSVKMAVVNPFDQNSMEGAMEAYEHEIIEPVFVGPLHKIKSCAEELGYDLTGIQIVDVPSHLAADKAVELARSKEVQALMKGSISSDLYLKAIIDKEKGLRTSSRLSHVFMLDVPHYHKPLMITDAAINVTPDLNCKKDIVQNTVNFAMSIGIEEPKVAVLAAVEKVKPSMQSTIDAAALCKMRDRNQITAGIIDGPLAFDNAISAEAAHDKHIESDVSGDADILLAPDLEAANMIAKQLVYLADAKPAGLVLGARVPIVLTSRSDKSFSRLASAALAALAAHDQEEAEKKKLLK